MNVLLLGSGGREHALALKITQSKLLTQLYIAPGNAGTLQCGSNVPIGVNDFGAIETFCLENNINMIVVGPEDPLVNGIFDYFQAAHLSHIKIIGPSKYGAQLEGSKEFAKQFMQRHHIPTARYKSFTNENFDEALPFLQSLTAPFVLKADGLAAGKGVLIIDSMEEALQELDQMINQKKFGQASATVVIEEFLEGIEVSFFAYTNGSDYVLLPEAKDYKRIGESDTGLNTGGMGAVSPVTFITDSLRNKIETQIIAPTINGLKQEKIIYTGFVFFGLMICNQKPYVIEYNCRMGDPETEVVVPRIQSDLLALFASSSLKDYKIESNPSYTVTVMCVAGGYPGHYEKGKIISGVYQSCESVIMHAGTMIKDNTLVTNGGRVLAITSKDADLQLALQKSYNTINQLCWDGIYYRKDIGKDLLAFI
ncbi:MAG: phosphoribosylamine--glycine ligase [Bacteroidetes bacterium]|nr:phosphoribosylamine--glycine ligase [Bacteroidota bacterium]